MFQQLYVFVLRYGLGFRVLVPSLEVLRLASGAVCRPPYWEAPGVVLISFFSLDFLSFVNDSLIRKLKKRPPHVPFFNDGVHSSSDK